MRRLLIVSVFAALGAGIGALLIVANGGYCSDGVSESFCGRRLFGWQFSSAVAIGYAVGFGAVIGASIGFLVDYAFGRLRQPREFIDQIE